MNLTFSFLFGLIVGSFLNVVIYRVPREENIAFPPSHCPKCNHKIKSYENIPLISYIFLKGRCSQCQNKISLIYPGIEMLTGILFALVYLKFSFTPEGFINAAFVAVLLCVFFIDLEHYIIPDSMSVIIILLGVGKLSFIKEQSLMNTLITTLVVFVIFYLIFVLSNEKFGGGDVKLFTALAFYFPWPLINILIVLASILGLIVAGSLILLGKLKKEEPIPFGPFIVVAAIITTFFGENIWTVYEEIIMVFLL